MASLFGTAIRRREDPRLITGRATYTDDIRLPGMAFAAFLRSPHAHARIKRIDTARARELPGVLAVFTAQDLDGQVGCIPTAWLVPNADLRTPPHPPLAADRVRYVGDAVAVVVAEDRYTARDALDLIEVEYEPLPAVVNQEQAMEPGAPQLHAEAPGNVAFRWTCGDLAKAEAAIDEAGQAPDGVVVRQRLVNQRLIPNAMETRGSVAQFNPATGEMTIWLASQNPHIHRVLLSGILGIPEHKLRIIAPEVGGGFGSKIPCYAEEALVAFAARTLGRPVKWSEERRENYMATIHGRDHIHDVVIAGRRDGTITAIKVRALANLGAYLSTAAPGVPTILFGLMLQGAYRISSVGC
ncbi:MAG: molybdopterin cofactor-binding domain-containing protein, partial [Bacillota bacterium]